MGPPPTKFYELRDNLQAGPPIINSAEDVRRHLFAALARHGVNPSSIVEVVVPPLPEHRVPGKTAIHLEVKRANGHVTRPRCAWVGGRQGWLLD